jgi:two-component system NtrC family sensor kinase
MRRGVSAKIFLAYAVLVIAFAGNASFTVYTIHRARQGVVANQAYLDLQGSVDAAWKSLNDFAGALGRNLRKEPNLALGVRIARRHLDDGLAAIDRYLEREPGSFRRPDFEAQRKQIEAFKADLDHLATELGSPGVGSDDRRWSEFESRFANLTRGINRMRRPLRGESALIAQRLAEDEENALQIALAVGALGLLLAALAAGFMWRTLRPLRVLRARAREIAGGEYARRTGVRSRDEIGDLARELDAMAAALEEREQRLIRSERLATVGKMAAQITHEVRNPLASIGLYVELLGDEMAERPEARRLITSITSEVDRLTEITETYLRFARLPRSKLDREDLGALVASVAEFARAELLRAGIILETNLQPGLEVAADENHVRQALLNLIRNAREAMDGGGRLTVRVSAREDGMAEIVVTDTGPGIAPEHVSKIFDPFFSTKAKGTGLGLALVQQIAVEHGGRVEVQSALGGGTIFRMVLPVWQETESDRKSGGGVGADRAGAAEVSQALLPMQLPLPSSAPSVAPGPSATAAPVVLVVDANLEA